MALLARLPSDRRLLTADGAWGTNLMAAGLDIAKDCAEHWNLTRPEAIRNLIRDFAAAGAELLTANTFGANRIRLEKFGLVGQLEAINRQAVAHVREGGGSSAIIGAAMGPTGLREFDGSADDLGRAYAEQARVLEDSGADFLLLETMTSPEEARIALDYIKRATALEVVCSYAFTRQPHGEYTTWSGAGVQAALSAAREGGADMFGVNCCPADPHLEELLVNVHQAAPEQRLWLKPNAGAPGAYKSPVHKLPAPLATLVDLNVAILGGCCGTTPEHIRVLSRMVATFNAAAPECR